MKTTQLIYYTRFIDNRERWTIRTVDGRIATEHAIPQVTYNALRETHDLLWTAGLCKRETYNGVSLNTVTYISAKES